MVAPKSTLKRFLDAKKTPSLLLGDFERHQLSRPPGDRSTTVLHPSEIVKQDWCLRQSYFLLRGHTKAQEKHSFRLQSIFDTGHAAHAKYQRYLQEMGILYGKFGCTICGHSYFGMASLDCESCGNPSMEYREVTLHDDSLRIKGHTDGWVKKADDEFLIEIKTIGTGTIRAEAPSLMEEHNGDFLKAFANIKHPFGSHILQGQLYLELMQRMGHDVNKIVFLYELKADQTLKEFVVERDFELVRHVFDLAKVVNDAVDAGTPPKCSNSPTTCKYCSPYQED